MSKAGMDKVLMAAIVGGLIGYFVGYAVNFEDDSGGSGDAGPVAVGSAKPVNAEPVRKLESSPFKGGENPKVLIHEVSDFQ